MKARRCYLGLVIVGVAAGSALPGAVLAHDGGSGCRHDHETSRIICNDSDNHFIGTPARDKVQLLRGVDHGDAGAGNDLVYGGPGPDKIQGSNGIDNIYGQKGNDTINGGNGADDLYEGDEDDPDDFDILCAGRDNAPDYLDAQDRDLLDRVYIDKGEDKALLDAITRDGFTFKDAIRPAGDCPLPE